MLTDTAAVHRAAWKTMFDAFLRRHARTTRGPVRPFTDDDYRRCVDGRRREDGVRAFLAGRGITLPDGDPADPPDADTVCGLGNRKNALFHELLERDGVHVFDGSRRYLEAVVAAGLGTAVVSSSANTAEVLRITGLDRYVQYRVDGVTMRDEQLAGKPAPDAYLRAAALLGVPPAEAAVFEDALPGVTAGAAGGFGFVVAVDRVGQADALRARGADLVVTDLAELLPGT